MKLLSLFGMVTGCLVFGGSIRAAEGRLTFHVRFDRSVSEKPFTGRVFVMLSRRKGREPRTGLTWTRPEPVYAIDVKDWKPGETVVLDEKALAFPVPLAELSKGLWTIQAVMDFNRGHRKFSNAPGNGYSKPKRLMLDPERQGPLKLHIDQVVKVVDLPDTERVRFVSIQSRLLSQFHKKPVRMRAGVVLPKSWHDQPGRKYPVLYRIPGFGGSHWSALTLQKRNATDVSGIEFICVLLNPECRWGHHVFADSANNGPWGKALVTELIPYLEKTYRGLGEPRGRFLTGHSSGGWSSLWLQVTYPDFFGGVWSTSPDPVDFRDFQLVDIYKPKNNIFWDGEGNKRPLARRNDKPILYYKSFSDMEAIMGHGGQLGSFEAAFSARGGDGLPRKLWDRKTGAIDPEVAESWKRYDIRLVLEKNWEALAPKLKGKFHIYMGGKDTYYLDGAVRLLQKSLKNLGSDAIVEIFPGRSHSLLDKKLRERIEEEMASHYERLTTGQKRSSER